MQQVKDSPIMYEGIEVNIEVTFWDILYPKKPKQCFSSKNEFWSLYHDSTVIEHKKPLLWSLLKLLH